MPEDPRYREMRVANLEKANRNRLARAKLRKEVTGLRREEGLALVADLIETKVEPIQRMLVYDLVCWIRLIGPQRAPDYLNGCGVSEYTKVGRLTPRQSGLIQNRLRDLAQLKEEKGWTR